MFLPPKLMIHIQPGETFCRGKVNLPDGEALVAEVIAEAEAGDGFNGCNLLSFRTSKPLGE